MVCDNFTPKNNQGKCAIYGDTPLNKIGGMKYIMSKEKLGKLALIQGAVEGRYTVMGAGLRLYLWMPRKNGADHRLKVSKE